MKRPLSPHISIYTHPLSSYLFVDLRESPVLTYYVYAALLDHLISCWYLEIERVYKWQITSLFSIAHRLTGILLCFGLFFVLYSLYCFAFQTPMVNGLIVQMIIWCNVWALHYHWCNGVRYLLWDRGIGMSQKAITYSAYGVLVLFGRSYFGSVLHE